MNNEYEHELSGIREASDRSIKRALLLWVIRWTIGFSIIGVIVHFNSNLSWLWWAGLAVALITPITSLLANWVLNRKMRETQKRLRELESALDQDEA